MKKHTKFFTVLLTVVMALSGMGGPVEAAAAGGVVIRLQGSGRVETAVEVSQFAYVEGADTVVLAGYRGEVDALTGTLLAGAKDAPLLLTEPRGLSKATKDEIVRLKAKTVYILGGTSVISEQVVADLEAMNNITVERVSGDNRFETAHEVAKAAEGKTTHVFLALGANESLADALSVGPVSAIKEMPVLLTTKNSIPDSTKKAMEALGVTDVTIVGGEAAISKAIKTTLEKDYRVDRVEGSTREGTAEAVAKRYFNEPTLAIVTNDGRVSYADALVGGYLGALIDAPILLTQANKLSEVTKKNIFDHIDNAFILGGSSAIAPAVVGQAEKAVAGIIEEVNGSDVVSNIRYEVIQEKGNDSVVVTFDEPADTSNIQFFLIEFSQDHGKTWENGILSGKSGDLEMRSAVPMVSVTPDSLSETLVYNRVKVISLGSEESDYLESEVEQALDFTFNVKGEAPGFRLYKDRYPTLEIGESTGGIYDFAHESGVGEKDRGGYFISMPKGENLYAMPTLKNYTNGAQFVLRKYTNMSEKGLTVTKPSAPVKFGK